MKTQINIRKATDIDRAFIFELSPRLAEVAQLAWHTDEVIQKMQDDYITAMLVKSAVPQITLIAEINAKPYGFIHARSHTDSISGEVCGTIPLLAVLPKAQGQGLGKLLIESVEVWAKELGYRLLHLEVFAKNNKAYSFYQQQGFTAETVHMIKNLN
ncbi:hypothetical protein GCM10009111_30310 [Colwellia asteriadis]|uniref:N-acetyltransferase domain-containing protein n=1 Tax=Colwellia asteriadis TaxID=517723 RepID=A0ABN1LA68_9GAMM